MLYIIGYSGKQAVDYMNAKGLDRRHTRVINTPEALRGMRNIHIKLVGSYKQRHNWDEFLEMFKIMDASTEEDTSW